MNGAMKAIAVLTVVVLSVSIFAVMSDGSDGYNESTKAVIGDVEYTSVSAAVSAAQKGDTITLVTNVTESITIGDGKEIVLNLNGKNITNTDGNHTITVESGGKLTINGTGTVDNVSHARACVYNNQGGTVVLDGGEYTRSKENGSNSASSGGNSYYNIDNYGTITINKDVKVTQNGGYSSMVHNGWKDGTKNTAKVNALMTIDGGSFSGGLNTVKNDDWGVLVINGGTITNVKQAALLNWNVCTINGGIFTVNAGGLSVIRNNYADGTMDLGKLTINGGEFDGDVMITKLDSAKPLGNITLSGGIFHEKINVNYTLAEGYTINEVGDKWYVQKAVAVKIAVQGEGSVDAEELEVPNGTAVSVKSNILTIGNTEVTATASDGYAFSGWLGLPSTVTSDLTITALFMKEDSDDEVEIDTDSAKIVIEKTEGTTSVVSEIKIDDVDDVDTAIVETLDKITSVQESSESSDVTVKIVVPVSDNGGKLEISKDTVTKLKESGAELTVSNNGTTVSLDTDVIQTLEKETTTQSSGTLSIVVTPDSTELTPAQKTVVGENKVVDVSAYLGAAKISDLGGKATVSVPYVTDKKVKVTYVMDNGKTENVECTYVDGVVSFITTHFSLYSISEIEESVPIVPDYDDDDYYPVIPVTPTNTSSNDDDNTKTIVACAAAAVAAALAVAFFLVDSRRP